MRREPLSQTPNLLYGHSALPATGSDARARAELNVGEYEHSTDRRAFSAGRDGRPVKFLSRFADAMSYPDLIIDPIEIESNESLIK
jgi:hypothetical protein